jgi:hypothetical protein
MHCLIYFRAMKENQTDNCLNLGQLMATKSTSILNQLNINEKTTRRRSNIQTNRFRST